jgi:chromosome segregation ATPase
VRVVAGGGGNLFLSCSLFFHILTKKKIKKKKTVTHRAAAERAETIDTLTTRLAQSRAQTEQALSQRDELQGSMAALAAKFERAEHELALTTNKLVRENEAHRAAIRSAAELSDSLRKAKSALEASEDLRRSDAARIDALGEALDSARKEASRMRVRVEEIARGERIAAADERQHQQQVEQQFAERDPRAGGGGGGSGGGGGGGGGSSVMRASSSMSSASAKSSRRIADTDDEKARMIAEALSSFVPTPAGGKSQITTAPDTVREGRPRAALARPPAAGRRLQLD